MAPVQAGPLAGTLWLLLASATGFGTAAVMAIKTALPRRRSAWERATTLSGSVLWSTSPLLAQEPCNASTLAPALVQGMLGVSSSHPRERLQVTAKKEKPMGLHTPHKTATDRTAGEVKCCESLCQGLVCWRASAGAPSKTDWTAWASCACGKQQCLGPQRGRVAVASRCCPMKASSGIRLSEQMFPWQRDLGTRCLQTCSQCRLCTGDDFPSTPLTPVLPAHCKASVQLPLEWKCYPSWDQLTGNTTQWIGYTCGPLVNQVIQALELFAVSCTLPALWQHWTYGVWKDYRILGSFSGRHSYTVNENP